MTAYKHLGGGPSKRLPEAVVAVRAEGVEPSKVQREDDIHDGADAKDSEEPAMQETVPILVAPERS
jgi:hypothetical protein